jgi:glutamine amidotransferase
MKQKVGIISYGAAGNTTSLKNAIALTGAVSIQIEKKSDLNNVDKIVIPGVGNFRSTMAELYRRDLVSRLVDEVKIKPTLGICLGMQLLGAIGLEGGVAEGLGVINTRIIPLSVQAKLPHMGFNKIKVLVPDRLLNGLDNESFYFMHSYRMENCSAVTSLAAYSNETFPASICQGSVYGVQFHPEKSRDQGIELLKNFVNI